MTTQQNSDLGWFTNLQGWLATILTRDSKTAGAIAEADGWVDDLFPANSSGGGIVHIPAAEFGFRAVLIDPTISNDELNDLTKAIDRWSGDSLRLQVYSPSPPFRLRKILAKSGLDRTASFEVYRWEKKNSAQHSNESGTAPDAAANYELQFEQGGFLIRPTVLEDVCQFKKFDQSHADHPSIAAYLPTILADPQFQSNVLFSEGQLVGHMTLRYCPNATVVYDLVIDQAFQRQGLGRMLIRHAVNLVQARQRESFHAICTPDLSRFYQACGLQPFSQMELWSRNPSTL